MRLFIGNVDYSADELALTELFEPYGPVRDVFIPKFIDGRPRGIAFLVMDDQVACDAIRKLNGAIFLGRALTVNEARPRTGRKEEG